MDVETWLDEVAGSSRPVVERLRRLVRAASSELTETIKWNAPSFADGDRDRVTLGLERNGGVRVVLHRGAAVRDATDLVFDDPDRVARWPSPDRGVATFGDLDAVEARATALKRLVRRWVEANRQA